MDRIKTGIPGYDALIQGGLIKNSVNLLSGGTGTGKTIFCLQFLWNGITKYNDNCIYISYEENEANLKEDAKGFGWDFDKINRKSKAKCNFFYIPPYNLQNFESLLIDKIASTRSKRVVIDSISSIGMSLEDNFEIRKGLYRLVDQLKNINCTTLLTSEVLGASPDTSESGGRLSRFGIVEFVSDSVVSFHYAGLGGLADRAVRIIKMRRTKHARGPVPMEITDNGIKIHPTKKRFGY